MILRCSHILGTPLGDIVDGWVAVEADRIVEVGRGDPLHREVTRVDGWLCPGFVDIHVHGGGGEAFQNGATSVGTVTAHHLAHGTTTMMASLVSAPVQVLAGLIADLGPAVVDDTIAGIHLEGPFLAQAARGAHNPEFLIDPDPSAVRRLTADPAVRMITLAPERTGGLEAIRAIVAAGAIAAVGHTVADYATTAAAIDAGATVATHLCNAMPPLHQREPGPVLALLEDDRVVVELINDGEHLHRAVVAGTLRSRPGRVALITDAMAASGLPDGQYELGGLAVDVTGGVPRLVDGGSLAGSTSSMDAAVARAIADGIAPATAVAAATTTPAAVLGRTDVGAIRSGSFADLVQLDDDFRVATVWRRGLEVPS